MVDLTTQMVRGALDAFVNLDAASARKAPKSQAFASTLNIELIWLHKHCPELNATDHLFKALKTHISANYQYKNIDQHAAYAQNFILQLSNKLVH